ncbi:NAD-dependent epimerase/dehydratase family protein [Paenibacillus sp. DMB20]|uniref:NAD-dependent epimerase/dehydratase family protein n=1 Tax=Paenibacillus sp. DMB20 TaxID=1642570 RepID=UPI000627AFD8|nr:NAD-dependent epimerase/dehydratase family protein [Paenibacillus sp. DMB20]KKO52065.1 NAD-dependent dehydratase [Paenibacillus sp. DMB20]
MARKILVLGGTRFFGKRLVEDLIASGEEVTILTRGRSADHFGNQVQRITVDRKDSDAFKQAVYETDYDVVYDNICYTPEEAAYAARLFAGHAGHYVLTSTLSVYDFADHPLREEDFDPYRYPVLTNDNGEYSYKEGKRQAEAVLFNRHDLNVVAVRFPIVLGIDDYTKRLWFHVEHALKGEPIGVPAPDASISFIHAGEAAAFLKWAGDVRFEGPVNACSNGAVSVTEVMEMIRQETGHAAPLLPSAGPERMSPFGIPGDWTMDNGRAETAGFSFWDVREWMPRLIAEISNELKKQTSS